MLEKERVRELWRARLGEQINYIVSHNVSTWNHDSQLTALSNLHSTKREVEREQAKYHEGGSK